MPMVTGDSEWAFEYNNLSVPIWPRRHYALSSSVWHKNFVKQMLPSE
jgi:hypothetical protein